LDADALHSALDRAAPRPCDKKITRTGAKKRKTLPPEEFALLLEDLRGRSDATSALYGATIWMRFFGRGDEMIVAERQQGKRIFDDVRFD
jgi:hypothetical protein